MPATLKNQFGISFANIFTKDIQQKRSNFYHFLGKLDSWNQGSDVPPTSIQTDSEFENSEIRNNATYFRKILPSDISLVVPRYNWELGTTYSQWDNTKNMIGENFYVFVDGKVFKCLHNNYNSPSTIKPTGANLDVQITADGYIWKYLYTIPKSKYDRFATNNYIPVQKALSESFYSNGSIESVVINNSGSGYIDANITTILLSNINTTGSGATLSFTLTATGAIATVTVTNGGSGYTKGARIKITSSNGVDALVVPTIVSGVITGATIINPGIAYDSSDSMEVYVGGAQLIPKINSETGSLEQVIIYDSGIGYQSAPTATLYSPTSTGATGKYGNPSAVLKCFVYDGSIQNVTIEDPGVNYLTSSTTKIVASGDGTGFYATPIISNGEIIDVLVENPGIGYTTISLSVEGDGTGASLTPIFAISDINSDQSIIEQVSVEGAIYSVAILNQGEGYSPDSTTVQITGDGTGATATATIVNGTITKINMVNFGKNYTRADIQIIDSARSNPLNELEDFSGYAILPVSGGHGSDAPKELFADKTLISSTFKADSVTIDFNQDYRQYGILRNPTNVSSNKKTTIDSCFNVYKLGVNTTVGLVSDEILIDDNDNEYKVVFFDDSKNLYLLHCKNYTDDPVGTLIAKDDPLRIYSIDGIVDRPIINKQSGELIYVSNEEPFMFTESQGITIKTLIKF